MTDAVRWRAVASQLRTLIDSGHYPPGTYLPPVKDLVTLYGVSIGTINSALKALQDEQLIRGIPKKGILVLDTRPVYVDLTLRVPEGGQGPWQTDCERSGVTGSAMKMIGVEQVPAERDVAELLHLSPGDPLIVRKRHATIDGQTVRIDTAYYPAHLVEGTPLAGRKRIPGGVYAALAAAGAAPVAIERRLIGARPAIDEELDALAMPRGSWVLTVDRVTRDEHGRMVELLRFAAHPRRVRLLDTDLPIAGT